MKKLNLTLVFAAFTAATCFCQLQNRYWYFGNNCGIDFGTTLNTPIAIPGIGNNTFEGVATISDYQIPGNFLFYTDGINGIRAPSTLFTTTLPGNPSSTQSAIIVPAPNSCDSFYIFTVDWVNGSNGLRYTTVKKNIWTPTPVVSLNASCIEKVTAIPHPNGTDYWIVSILPTAASVNRQFLVWRLSSTGVVALLPQVIAGCPFAPTAAMYGSLKGSCNGTYLAAAFGNGTSGVVGVADNRVELFGFNPISGAITSYIQTYPINSAYGIEFSPNGQYLFCSGLGSSSTFGIVNEYDLSIPFSTTTVNTINITDPLGYDAGALQLAPNGKIYLAKEGEPSLDAFNTPNLSNWSYQQNAITFTSTIGISRLGLPNTICNFNTCIENNTCCSDLKNLIVNFDFNNKIPPLGYISQYPYDNGLPSSGSLTPGESTIINSSEANIICDKWNLKDHSTCSATNGNFLVVNGRTGQVAPLTPKKLIWRQTISGLQKDSAYEFCANFKNLPQCYTDIKPRVDVTPKIDIIFSSAPSNNILGQVINVIPGTTANCGWKKITAAINNQPTGPMTISIWLDETSLGTGNDLAIDDIAFYKTPTVSNTLTTFTSSLPTPTGPYPYLNSYTFTALPLPPLCSCGWEVCEVDPITYLCIPGTEVINDPSWWSLPNYCTSFNFAGYNGYNFGSLPLLGSLTNPGAFDFHKIYRIRRSVWCECKGGGIYTYYLKI